MINRRSSITACEWYGQVASWDIRTTSMFGFAMNGAGPQRLGGFGHGTWQSQTEREFYAAIRDQYLTGRSEKNSQLMDDEADAAVAAKSFPRSY
jgi:hypothetical protein